MNNFDIKYVECAKSHYEYVNQQIENVKNNGETMYKFPGIIKTYIELPKCRSLIHHSYWNNLLLIDLETMQKLENDNKDYKFPLFTSLSSRPGIFW